MAYTGLVKLLISFLNPISRSASWNCEVFAWFGSITTTTGSCSFSFGFSLHDYVVGTCAIGVDSYSSYDNREIKSKSMFLKDPSSEIRSAR